MKKIIALLLVLVMVLGLVACGAKKDDGKVRIFMSAAYYTAPYGSPLMGAIQEKGEAMGYEVTIVDGEVNADKQLTQFKTAVADGYDALIYWPGDSASTPPVVEYLNSTGLPWVVVNTVPLPELYDQCTIIASDELQIGREGIHFSCVSCADRQILYHLYNLRSPRGLFNTDIFKLLSPLPLHCLIS